MYVDNTTSSDIGYYIHTDYLGSVIALSDDDGDIIQEYSYDAWGKRRDPNDWRRADNRLGFICDRGYTGHEHLDDFDLINMNGRVYDPHVAMFLSPDPVLQDPGNTLNFNRYSYAFNNPLKYTDPSGYITAPMRFSTWHGGHGGAHSRFSESPSGGGGSSSSFERMGTIFGSDGSINYPGYSNEQIDYWLDAKQDGYNGSLSTFYNNNITTYMGDDAIIAASYLRANPNYTVGDGIVTVNGLIKGEFLYNGGSSFVKGPIDLQGGNVISQMVELFAEIQKNNGVNPYTRQTYHVSDIIDPESLPEKHWFNKIFSSMTNDGADGTSYFGDKMAQWYLVDRSFMQNYNENYIAYIYGDHPGGNMYRIRAMYNNETRISLIFYDHDLYQTMYNRIFK